MTATPRLILLCATERGRTVLERLVALIPASRLCVFSFRESPGEPLFFQNIASLARDSGAAFRDYSQSGIGGLRDELRASRASVILAVGWRFMVPREVYAQAQDAFVIHDSLLPEYRGFSPTVWAIINGADHTGATLFVMSEGVDDGDVIDQRRIPIKVNDTIADVMAAVTAAYVELVEKNLDSLLDGSFRRTAQVEAAATYACRRLPEDAAIDWALPTVSIYNLIRALGSPYQAARTTLDGNPLRIWSARPGREDRVYTGRIPGRVIAVNGDGSASVLTGDGILDLLTVQLGEGPVGRAAVVLSSLSCTLGR